MPVVFAVNGNLCLFRLAQTWRRDDFVDGSRHGGTWLFSNSRSIQIQFRNSCGAGLSLAKILSSPENAQFRSTSFVKGAFLGPVYMPEWVVRAV